jgi:hypothetical protein
LDCICISEQAGFAGLARSVRPRSLDFRGAHYLRLAHSGCAWGTVPVIFSSANTCGRNRPATPSHVQQWLNESNWSCKEIT